MLACIHKQLDIHIHTHFCVSEQDEVPSVFVYVSLSAEDKKEAAGRVDQDQNKRVFVLRL